ncbi:MAG: hypothetical protein JK586_09250 [Nocardiopsis sp. BM-2018]|nr:MAG: hypothetical protein JK586_09250 [Nocardiopsis sp. BM-2018]
MAQSEALEIERSMDAALRALHAGHAASAAESMYFVCYEAAVPAARVMGLETGRRYILREHVRDAFVPHGVISRDSAALFERLFQVRAAADRKQPAAVRLEEAGSYVPRVQRFVRESARFLEVQGRPFPDGVSSAASGCALR